MAARSSLQPASLQPASLQPASLQPDAWRAQVHEPAIDPGLPIIDAHHHIWLVAPLAGHEPYPDEAVIGDVADSGHAVFATIAVEPRGSYRDEADGAAPGGRPRARLVSSGRFCTGSAPTASPAALFWRHIATTMSAGSKACRCGSAGR